MNTKNINYLNLHKPPKATKTIKEIKIPITAPTQRVSSGDSNIDNKKISKGEWVIIVLSIIMLLLMVFVAIRQGMFDFKTHS